jgi:hypothetical protein
VELGGALATLVSALAAFQSSVLQEAYELTILSNDGERAYAIAFH